MVESQQTVDYIGFSQDSGLMQLIGNDTLLFADKVKKTNMFDWTQERTLAITDNALYNIHKKSIKRCIRIDTIGALIKTISKRNMKEFTVHVPTEYDYRFTSEKRDEIMDVIKRAYIKLLNRNCAIYGVDAKDLHDFTTTEKDMNKGQSRFPTPEYQITNEDLLKTSDADKAQDQMSKVTLKDEDDYDAQKAARSKQLTATPTDSDSTTNDDEENVAGMDELDDQIKSSMAAGGDNVFSRDSTPAKLSDFEFRKLIGKGTFGKVFLVQNKNNKQLYAMKCIRKDVILENEQMENIQLEKDILYSIQHPFLVNMEYVFQNEFRIYFLMKFVKGGELFRHLVTVKRFPEDQAKFFAAQVAMALAHLHSKKIIYRDLKPENVLVGEDGYLLVADFGLAKFVQDGELANSFCGTAEYLAPEMLIGNGHDYTVDWWALGVLIYEMIVGIPPFFHRNKHRMYFLIKESDVNFPDPVRHKISVSAEAQDLIVKLLDKSRKTRLGANGVDEILQHPWFADLDMASLMMKEIDPPYKPAISEDFAYFDPKLIQQTEVSDTILPTASQAVVNKSKHQFEGFSS